MRKKKIPKKILEVLPVPEEQLIMFSKFGSHLYGTNTPESDQDFKGVYLPTREQILLQKVQKAYSYHSKKDKQEGVRNTKKDIDIQIFSLHHFIDLACKGETVSLDMLHIPEGFAYVTSDIWEYIIKHRRHFYTKNLNAFVSYARKQAAKYGIKGSRLADIKNVIDFLNKKIEISKKCMGKLSPKLLTIWEELPAGEHIHKLDEELHVEARMYQVAGKKFGSTCTFEYVCDILQRYYARYGERAKKAEKNEGIDWKAVSHAVRAALQVSELLCRGSITFPLRQAHLVKKIKLGEYSYTKQVAPLLELYIDQCEKFSALSTLPNKVNRPYWDGWLMFVCEELLAKKDIPSK